MDLDLNQLMYLQTFFKIREEQGEDAAVEWAESVVATYEGKEEAKEKPHLTAVK